MCSSCSPSFQPHLCLSHYSTCNLSPGPGTAYYSLPEASEFPFLPLQIFFSLPGKPLSDFPTQWSQLRIISITLSSTSFLWCSKDGTTFPSPKWTLRACADLIFLCWAFGMANQTGYLTLYLMNIYWIHRMQILGPIHHLVKKNIKSWL